MICAWTSAAALVTVNVPAAADSVHSDHGVDVVADRRLTVAVHQYRRN